jgi:hypothetical protein
MNSLDHITAPECARFTPLLPVLDDTDISSEPSVSTNPAHAAALAHLRTCAHCRALRDEYRRLDDALSKRYGLGSIPRHATAEIMSAIAERTAAPSRRFPSGRSRIISFPGARPRLSGLAALASVLVIAVLALLLLDTRFGFGPGRGAGSSSSFAGTEGGVYDVSMISPSEGWALARITKTPSGVVSPDMVTFYHFKNGVWTPTAVRVPASFALSEMIKGAPLEGGAISMDSATDGWAVLNHGPTRVSVGGLIGPSLLFHYANGAWTIADPGPVGDLLTIQALSPTSVWAVASVQSGSQGDAHIMHYDGVSWTSESVAGLAPGDSGRVDGLHMLSADDGWALVYLHGNTSGLAHFARSVWTVDPTTETDLFGPLAISERLAMVSDTEAWVPGGHILVNASPDTRPTFSPTASASSSQLKLVMYHFHDGVWTQETLPLAPSYGNGIFTLGAIAMRSPSDGWLAGVFHPSGNENEGFNVPTDQPIMFHYSGGKWRVVPIPATGTTKMYIGGLAFTADGSVWSAGTAEDLTPYYNSRDEYGPFYPVLWSYRNDAWTIYHQ